MGDQKRAWYGDRAREGKAIAMDVGRMCVLHGAALCLHAAWSHCSYSCTVELVGVLGARGCVTSVRSYSDPPIQVRERLQ